MAQQNINIGAANQGNGDTLFDAFTKVQANFTELYTDESQGEVNSIVAGTGVSVSSATGDVTVTNSAPNANHTGEVTGSGELTITNGAVTNAKMAANSVDSDQYVDGSIDTVHLADDIVTQDKLANQFKTTDAKGSVSGSQTLDFGANQVFTATLTASTTFGITNAEIGMVKDLYVTGSFDLAITNGKKVAGTYDGSVTNLIQIVAQTPTSFWYSISQEQV